MPDASGEYVTSIPHWFDIVFVVVI